MLISDNDEPSDSLTRRELVGQLIAGVFETERRNDSGIVVCKAVVRLANGTLFELGRYKGGVPIPRAHCGLDLKLANGECLHDADIALVPGDTGSWREQRIVEVVDSELWFSFGLLLSNKRVMYFDSGIGTDAFFVRLEPLGLRDTSEEDLVDYFSQEPLKISGYDFTT